MVNMTGEFVRVGGIGVKKNERKGSERNSKCGHLGFRLPELVYLLLGFGFPQTRLKWSMARSKATRTAFLWNAEHDSTSFRRSSDGWIPKGAILDLGSHCQLRLLSKKWTRNSFSSDLNCIRSPSLSTSRDGWGRFSPGNRRPVFRA